MSFSALGLILSSSPSFSGKFDPELPEEKKIAVLAHTLKDQLSLDHQKTLTYGNTTFVTGEVPGDGDCILHTLHVLFPEKGINRAEFVQRLTQAVRGTAMESDEIKKELAYEFFSALQSHVWLGETKPFNVFEGKNIKNIIPLLDFFNVDKLEDNITRIQNDHDVIEDIINTLSQQGRMLAVSPNPNYFGSFGLACKLFRLNLDVFTTLRGTDRITLRTSATEERTSHCSYRFDNNAPIKSALFNTGGNHCVPLSDIGDHLTRKRMADRILQMVQKGEGIYQVLEAAQRVSLLDEPLKLPVQEVKTITSPVVPIVPIVPIVPTLAPFATFAPFALVVGKARNRDLDVGH